MAMVESIFGVPVRGYFKGASKHTHVQFFRYGFVAALAFLIDFGTLALLASGLHVYYLLAAAISFTLGLFVNYGLSTVWVFNAYNVSSRKKEFSVFVITGIIGLALTELFMWVLTGPVHLFYLVSKLIATCIVVVWNFSSRKYLLYR
jgi:putative flippase GtrA